MTGLEEWVLEMISWLVKILDKAAFQESQLATSEITTRAAEKLTKALSALLLRHSHTLGLLDESFEILCQPLFGCQQHAVG